MDATDSRTTVARCYCRHSLACCSNEIGRAKCRDFGSIVSLLQSQRTALSSVADMGSNHVRLPETSSETRLVDQTQRTFARRVTIMTRRERRRLGWPEIWLDRTSVVARLFEKKLSTHQGHHKLLSKFWPLPFKVSQMLLQVRNHGTPLG